MAERLKVTQIKSKVSEKQNQRDTLLRQDRRPPRQG
jgi:hypothetical protein